MSSIRIPAFDLHKSLITEWTSMLRGCLFTDTSGECSKFQMLTERSSQTMTTHSRWHVPWLKRGPQKCYIYGVKYKSPSWHYMSCRHIHHSWWYSEKSRGVCVCTFQVWDQGCVSVCVSECSAVRIAGVPASHQRWLLLTLAHITFCKDFEQNRMMPIPWSQKRIESRQHNNSSLLWLSLTSTVSQSGQKSPAK